MVPLLAPLGLLEGEVVQCTRCPRLREYCQAVAVAKRRAYREWEYWGRPVPAFGDAQARLVILGLAPGAHGSNRTGRMFTGDRSGDILYSALYRTGFASQPHSTSREDGLTLSGVFITAAARCAPPANQPTRDELANCRPFFERELDLLPDVRVVVALGRVAFDTYLDVLKARGTIRNRAAFGFGHDRVFRPGDRHPVLISSYHPSQQNTSTGKLTETMLVSVFRRARKILDRETARGNRR